MKQFLMFAAVLLIIALSAVFLSGAITWNALHLSILLAGCAVAVSFVFGIGTGDYSWVDRMWSTVPVVFAWIYAAKSDGLIAMYILAGIITLWGARLTFNFARKGGYTGTEDYRWPILRKRITSPVAWQLFHLLFINGFQVSLFILFTLPLHALTLSEAASITPSSVIFMVLMICAVLFETIADQQQWEFHRDKRGFGKGTYTSIVRQGFMSKGLFSWSRHPNYFGELSFWWLLYICVGILTGNLLNFSIIGPVLLTLLFIGSTRFTESITASKYPEYAEYQKQTSAIVPLPPRKRQTKETPASR